MIKSLFVSCAVAITLAFSFSPVTSFAQGDVEEITIDVAPNVLNIGSQFEIVTIHTDINYLVDSSYSVEGTSVKLFINGCETFISSWLSDDRGNFVAKTYPEDMEAFDNECFEFDDDNNIIELTGNYTGAYTSIYGYESFHGSQSIRIVNNEATDESPKARDQKRQGPKKKDAPTPKGPK